MKLIRLVIILFIFSSCKKLENNKQDSATQDSYQKTEPNNDNHIEDTGPKKDCIIYSDSIKIKKYISVVQRNLSQKDISSFTNKYNLERDIHKKDKTTLLNSKPELYFEKDKDGCLTSIIYFNYNFSKNKGEYSWKGEHQTIMMIEKKDHNFRIKDINHL